MKMVITDDATFVTDIGYWYRFHHFRYVETNITHSSVYVKVLGIILDKLMHNEMT